MLLHCQEQGEPKEKKGVPFATPVSSIIRDTDLHQKIQKSPLWLICMGGLPFSEAKGLDWGRGCGEGLGGEGEGREMDQAGKLINKNDRNLGRRRR